MEKIFVAIHGASHGSHDPEAFLAARACLAAGNREPEAACYRWQPTRQAVLVWPTR